MITVNDIREKAFGKQKHGYDEDHVDDFLDELADQMEKLLQENRDLMLRAEEAEVAAARLEEERDQLAEKQAQVQFAAEPAPVEVSVAAPAFQPPIDEPSYFHNLEMTLKETLISAQRIADNTVAEARVKAKDLVSGAEEQARKIADDAAQAAQLTRTEIEMLKKALDEYKARFKRLVKDQMDVIELDDAKAGDA